MVYSEDSTHKDDSISHATLLAWFNITKLPANLLTKPSVFLLVCQLYFVILFQ